MTSSIKDRYLKIKLIVFYYICVHANLLYAADRKGQTGEVGDYGQLFNKFIIEQGVEGTPGKIGVVLLLSAAAYAFTKNVMMSIMALIATIILGNAVYFSKFFMGAGQ